jgi:hypothetical protein
MPAERARTRALAPGPARGWGARAPGRVSRPARARVDGAAARARVLCTEACSLDQCLFLGWGAPGQAGRAAAPPPPSPGVRSRRRGGRAGGGAQRRPAARAAPPHRPAAIISSLRLPSQPGAVAPRPEKTVQSPRRRAHADPGGARARARLGARSWPHATHWEEGTGDAAAPGAGAGAEGEEERGEEREPAGARWARAAGGSHTHSARGPRWGENLLPLLRPGRGGRCCAWRFTPRPLRGGGGGRRGSRWLW